MRRTRTARTEPAPVAAQLGRRMPNQPRADNPARAIRVPDTLWHAALAKAAERGETVSGIVRAALERYVTK